MSAVRRYEDVVIGPGMIVRRGKWVEEGPAQARKVQPGNVNMWWLDTLPELVKREPPR